MATTRKLLHHLTLFLCLISFSLSPVPSTCQTSNTALHLPKYHLSLSLSHLSTIAQWHSTSRGELSAGFISWSATSKTVTDCALVFLQHKLGRKACELFPGSLRLCVIGWILVVCACAHAYVNSCMFVWYRRWSGYFSLWPLHTFLGSLSCLVWA